MADKAVAQKSTSKIAHWDHAIPTRGPQSQHNYKIPILHLLLGRGKCPGTGRHQFNTVESGQVRFFGRFPLGLCQLWTRIPLKSNKDTRHSRLFNYTASERLSVDSIANFNNMVERSLLHLRCCYWSSFIIHSVAHVHSGTPPEHAISDITAFKFKTTLTRSRFVGASELQHLCAAHSLQHLQPMH